jgi:Cu(I)/Ag(I) efflux system protein CusF
MKKLMLVLALTGSLAATAAAAVARATGVVKGMDASIGRIIITHDPVPALKWPAMTMSFRISKELAKGLKEGQKVEFEFEPRDMDGTITQVKVLPPRS